jgi:L,D-peptidoglycan transpeptidase YkuD (ErfK/YbiS/YcfS/YnhG family)
MLDDISKKTLSDAARIMARHSAFKAGRARMAKLTREELTELGKKGARARWRKKRKKTP